MNHNPNYSEQTRTLQKILGDALDHTAQLDDELAEGNRTWGRWSWNAGTPSPNSPGC
jgi:hypothetical protein